LIIKEIATVHMRLAMTGSEFFNKGLYVLSAATSAGDRDRERAGLLLALGDLHEGPAGYGRIVAAVVPNLPGKAVEE